LALVLVVVLPFVGVLIYVGYRDVKDDARRAQMAALDLARVSAAETGEALEDAATVAATIAARAARAGIAACDVLNLPEVVALEPEFANAFVADATGRPRCSAVQMPPGGVESGVDRLWFSAARAADTVVFDGPIKGRISGRWVYVAALAIRDPRGRLMGVVGVSADMERFSTALTSFPLDDSRVIMVITDEGQVVTRSRDTGPWTGSLLAEHGFAADSAVMGNATVFRGTDLDGVDRLWGAATVERTGWRVLAGVNRSVVLGPGQATLTRGMLLSGVLALTVLGLALLAARRIERPIEELVQATAAVERGEFRTVSPFRGVAEVSEVARRFNAMVGARAAAEASLRASEARFQKAFGASPMPMAISAWPGGEVMDVNEAYVARFGWSRGDIIGRTALDIGLWRNPDEREAMRRDLEAGRPVRNRECEFRKKSGETMVGLFSAERIELAEQPCVISLVVDVTERRRLELQLRQAQKMEAVGQLTGGIAHDFNNLLTAVLGNAELIASDLPADRQDLSAELDDIRSAARRGASMVKKLLAFSRKERLETAPVDLADVVRDVSGMLQHLVPETIRIDLSGVQPGVWVPADRGALDQILINLVTNARDAMLQGGDLLLATRRASIDRTFWMEHGWGEPGDYGVLSVRDTGVGMDEETRAHMFEPFFTTKPREQGTGLGMAMVYGLVKQHGGFVSVESRLGHGTTVVIYLPATDRPEKQKPPVEVRKALEGRETVLLVEDDELIREAGRRALQSRGYQVLTATDGEDALQILLREPGRVALVVTDVVMPRRTGPELFHAVRSQPHAPRFLFTSGYAEFAGGPGGGVPPGADLLAKPWSVADLVSRVRTVLDKTG
jgi:PAS domain S-box-containing protein